jgi:hypothetical protein
VTHRFMSREAIEARRQRVRELLEKYPDMSTSVIQQRTGAGDDIVRRIRAQMRREKRVE